MKTFRDRVWLLCTFIFVVVLSACGGGGGGGGGSSEPPDTGVPPSISSQPGNQSARVGQSATFSVAAAGTAPFTYQWFRNGVSVEGAVGASYTIPSVSTADSGVSFTVAVTNAKGTVTSSAATLAVPAKIAGIVLQDNAEIQLSQATYSLRGELVVELPGDLPLIRWKVVGPTTAQGTVQPTSRQFSVDVPVALGSNQVEVSAEDGAATPIVFTKQIIRNAEEAFTGTLELTRNLVFVNESAVALARVAVDASRVVAGSVRLVQVNSDGTETSVANMVDNGSLSQGDEVQSDGIYSANITILAAAEGERTYRATATLVQGGSTASTVTRAVRVASRLPDATLTTILKTQQEATDRLKAAAGSGVAALKSAVLGEISTLRANPDVAVASANDAGTAISVLYKSGIAGVIGDPDASVKGGVRAQAATSRALGVRGTDAPIELQSAASKPYADFAGACPPAKAVQRKRATIQSAGNVGALAETSTTPSIGSNRVYALAANYVEWGEDDDVPVLAAQLQANRCLDVTYKRTTTTGGGSVEDFKNLDRYGMVLISSHGDTHYSLLGSDTFTAWSTMYKQFGWTPASAQVVLYSNMRVTTANKATYEADLKAGRLVIWGTSYGIMPSFIRQYSGTLPSSIVYMSICRGSWNNTMGDAFISKGARAYLGYSDYVAVPFTKNTGTKLFTEFLKSTNTLQDAFDSITPKVETDSDPAEFRLIGASNVQVGLGGLRDGDFETGGLGAWTATGDGRIIRQLGAAVPTGTYMGIISTGLGFTTTSGSLSQTLCLGAETQISYRWNFQSEEFLEFVGSMFQDSFLVTLVDVDDPNNRVIVQQDTIDSLGSSVTKVANSFDQGGVYATGWRTTTFTIPAALRGKRVRLTFSATDVGDSIYDTAVLLDDIKLQ
jgi:hypothetical protein